MTDSDVITELDIADPIVVWVQCEQGETGCTGGNHAADMVADAGGWVCPGCYATMRADYEENERLKWMWTR